MKQPWIHKSKTDLAFILSPTFVVLIIVILGQNWLAKIEESYSFYTWLFLIIFVDVAHVYATLFKTYFVKSEFQRRKKLFISLPIICFIIGSVLFAFGSHFFWSVMAYIAVFHFIRQQYGFMRLYSRYEDKTYAWIDNLMIYATMIYPMLYWFLSPDRKFNWFVENEFIRFENKTLVVVLGWIYIFLIAFYTLRTIYISIKNNYFNIPKNILILGTALSWYFGIVYYNNDLVFTLLNVVSHGVPYMALIYLNEIDKRKVSDLKNLNFLKGLKGVFFFILILLIIAFSEEYLWEILVWSEHFSIKAYDFSEWHFLFVPLLTVPQFTHYLLDGFIWKKNKSI